MLKSGMVAKTAKNNSSKINVVTPDDAFHELVEKRRLNLANAVNGIFGQESLVSQLFKDTPRRVERPSARRVREVSEPKRRSQRLQNIPATELFLPDDKPSEDDASPSRPRKKRKVVRQVDHPLSKADLTKLQNAPDEWLDEFKEYLKNVEEVSEGNFRNVIKQVTKLVNGEGITCRHWEKGVYFYKGKKITLSTDFSALRIEAIEFEDTHGEDPGHGWRLTHPIQKLRNFQLYYLGKKCDFVARK
jgi:hypothetical protein